mgnify:CR=1 FL=1|jgi:hypothetical protein
MADPVIPSRAKLFVGILANSDLMVEKAEAVLMKKFGAIDYKTAKIPFAHTDYYKTLGSNLFKVLVAFEKLVRREEIVRIKLFTNDLEFKLSGKEKRRINIDPGYLTLSNVFLASCKEYFHRVYLDRGVYLENEYRYVGKRFEPWDWTYPDYRHPEYLNFFYTVRKRYHDQLKQGKG